MTTRKSKGPDALTDLLRHGDPAGDGTVAAADPARRAALLAACRQDVTADALPALPASPPRRRTRPAFAVAAAAALASALAVGLYPLLRAGQTPEAPAARRVVAAGAALTPAPAAPPKAGPTKPSVRPNRAASRVVPPRQRRNPRKRPVFVAVAPKERQAVPVRPPRHEQKQGPAVPQHAPTLPDPVRTAAVPATSAGPVVERVILIADDTPLDPEPSSPPPVVRVAVAASGGGQSSVITSRPAPDGGTGENLE